jgi:hypothetical protein
MHSPDIFPALMIGPRSASSRCISLAFQMRRFAAASRRFHFMRAPFSVRQPLQTDCAALLASDPAVFDELAMGVLWRMVVTSHSWPSSSWIAIMSMPDRYICEAQ